MIGVVETQPILGPAIRPPADPSFRDNRKREARLGRLRHGAIIAAALAHAAVIAALLVEWPFSFARPLPETPPIAVALVNEVPAPEPPQAKLPPAPQLHELRSGRDQETTAPPQADAQGPEAAPRPEPEQDQNATPALAKPKPSQETASPKPKEATRETAPQPTKRGSVDRAPGEEREGDPYLNRLWTLIEQHRTYPAGAVGSFGLNLEGTVVYVIALSPAGAIQGMRLERSSGAPVLDDTARRMIEQAAPFPPLPNYFPRNGVTLSVTIHLFPTAS